MPYLRREQDGSFLLFETLEELEKNQDGINLVERDPVRLLCRKSERKNSVEVINNWFPELAHLKLGNVLYLTSESELYRSLAVNILDPIEGKPNWFRNQLTGHLYEYLPVRDAYYKYDEQGNSIAAPPPDDFLEEDESNYISTPCDMSVLEQPSYRTRRYAGDNEEPDEKLNHPDYWNQL